MEKLFKNLDHKARVLGLFKDHIAAVMYSDLKAEVKLFELSRVIQVNQKLLDEALNEVNAEMAELWEVA